MNKTLCALCKKLEWQLRELDNQLLTLEQELTNLDLVINENRQKINNASTIPAFILPEREIARLNFMICQQQIEDELNTNKKELQAQKTTLKSRQLRFKKELHLLEKHQENQVKDKRKQALLKQQNNSDEWALQQRTSA